MFHPLLTRRAGAAAALGSRPRRLVAGAIAAGTLLAAGLGQAVLAAPAANSSLQKGLNFYRGKTVTFIIPGNPGAAPDLEGRALAGPIGAYLHATVNVEDMGIAAGLPGEDTMAASNPDGLTIGEMTLQPLATTQLSNTPGLTFNPLREAWLGGNPNPPQIIFVSPSSPYQTFTQLLKSPTPIKMQALAPPGPQIERALMGILGIKTQYLVYPNLPTENAGWVRGDAPVSFNNLANAGPFLTSGSAKAVFTTFVPPAGFAFRSVLLGLPTLSEVVAKNPPKTAARKKAYAALVDLIDDTGTEVMTQTAVASYKVVALKAAVEAAIKNSAVHVQLLSEGIDPSYYPGPTFKLRYGQILQLGKPLACYFAATC